METVIHSDNDFATVAYLRIRNAVLIPKEEARTAEPRRPPLLESRFTEVLDKVTESPTSEEPSPSSGGEIPDNTNLISEFSTRDKQIGPWVAIGNVQRTTQGEISVADEVRECLHLLEGATTSPSSLFVCQFTMSRSPEEIFTRPLSLRQHQRLPVGH